MIENRLEMPFFNYLFALGIVLITMTSLRFNSLPLGVGEFLLIIWLIREWIVIFKKKYLAISKRQLDIVIFWISFLIVLNIGVLYSAFIGRLNLADALYDILAYIFAFIICLTLALKHKENSLNIKVKLIVIMGTLVFSFLAFWWLFIGNDFLGIPLGDYRFTGGARNPNQLALFISVIPYLCVYFLFHREREKVLNKNTLLFFLLLLLSMFIGNQIHSSGLFGTWILSIAFLIILLIIFKIKYPLNLITILITSITIAGILIYNNELIFYTFMYLSEWFVELDKDGSRGYLWFLGIETGMKSPFFGFGPGPQVDSIYSITQRAEVHNTFVDLFTQAGFIGLFIYFWLIIKAFKRSKSNIFLLLILFTLLFFSISHFLLRQPVFWVYLMFVFSAIENKNLGRLNGKS